MQRLLISIALSALLLTSSASAQQWTDTGEPCSVIRARNEGVPWTSYQVLPLRCVPMKDRVSKVYPLGIGTVPKGLHCWNEIFYDKQGYPGRVCRPVVIIAKTRLNRPCEKGDFDILEAWRLKFCRGAGTGLLGCDDGKVAIDIDAQDYCHITIYEHRR